MWVSSHPLIIQPDILAKGGDYTVDTVVGRDVVEARAAGWCWFLSCPGTAARPSSIGSGAGWGARSNRSASGADPGGVNFNLGSEGPAVHRLLSTQARTFSARRSASSYSSSVTDSKRPGYLVSTAYRVRMTARSHFRGFPSRWLPVPGKGGPGYEQTGKPPPPGMKSVFRAFSADC